MNASPVVHADGQAGAVAEQQVGDRAQQVGLADAGRPADEERVVGLRGHLGDGQRGGVGEAVAVADDELVEGELGVAERPGVLGRLAGVRRTALSEPGLAARGARRAQHRRVRGRGSSSVRGAEQLDRRRPGRARARRSPGAPCRSVADPAAGAAAGAGDDEALAGELDRAQRARARCGRWARRRRRRARACTRDQMCSSSALTAASIRFSPGESDEDDSRGGPAGPGRATIANAPAGCPAGSPQLAGKIARGCRVLYCKPTRRARRGPSGPSSEARARRRSENIRA